MSVVKSSPAMITTSPFCAICTATLMPGQYHQELLDDHMVYVCCDCKTLHPRSGRYSFGGGARDGANAPHGHSESRNGGRRRGKGKS